MTEATGLLLRIGQTLNVIPKDYSLQIKKEITNTNLSHLIVLSKLLILMNVLMLIVDMLVYYQKWSGNVGYLYLFYAHIALLLERSLFLCFVYLINHRRLNYLYKLKKAMVIYSAIVVLGWCTYISINAQAFQGQISAYLVGSFCIASVVLLLPLESLMIFFANSAAFVFVLFMKHGDISVLIPNIVNILFAFFFTFVMTYINIFMFTKNYVNKKTIQAQALELQNSRSKLEETVKLRTDELMRANEQLIKEMGIRHEIELQSIKTRLMYEENNLLLKEIKEYEELRNVFFANLSHELRTPLNVIFSAQQMMNLIINTLQHNSCKDQMIKYNKIVKQNCYRLIRLIGNLIDITKLDAKYFEIEKKNCDIIRVVENITESVAEYIKDKNIELSFITVMIEKVIACDPDKIERIMLNLLSNAVKFTPDNGIIKVHMSIITGYVVISVKDSGVGISKEMQKAIFERFVQADKSMTRNREGSGIGLSLVKSLVDLHQGNICLYSEPGKGSEFVVELPDILIPVEDSIAYTEAASTRDQNIERINIEFSDIYS